MWRTNWFETHKAETRLCHYGSLNAQQRNRHQRCLPRRELSVSMPMCDKSGLLSASNVCSTNVCSTNRRDYQCIQQTDKQTTHARSAKGATSPNNLADYMFQAKKKQIRFKHRPLPFTATFWRTTIASRILYESPYMDIEGVSVDNFAIDRLHTWDLGPLQRYIALVFWIMIEFKVWECDIAYLDASCALHLCLLQLRGDMWTYYHCKRYKDPSWRKKGSEVTTLGIYMHVVFVRVCLLISKHTRTNTRTKHLRNTLYGAKVKEEGPNTVDQ